MIDLLHSLSDLPPALAWLIFLVENALLTAIALYIGNIFLKKNRLTKPTRREWTICLLTNILNTVVTYTGYWLWKHQLIVITLDVSWRIITDLILLFFAMDLLMYVFHWLIHKTILYRLIHQLHHEAIDPKPIDLFILHPVETLSFGALWLVLLMTHAFNFYAVLIYLAVNLFFGIIGHLGIEPMPDRLRYSPVIRYLGTSTFHHDHHQDVQHNFGFYTSIWDRLFKTYK